MEISHLSEAQSVQTLISCSKAAFGHLQRGLGIKNYLQESIHYLFFHNSAAGVLMLQCLRPWSRSHTYICTHRPLYQVHLACTGWDTLFTFRTASILRGIDSISCWSGCCPAVVDLLPQRQNLLSVDWEVFFFVGSLVMRCAPRVQFRPSSFFTLYIPLGCHFSEI